MVEKGIENIYWLRKQQRQVEWIEKENMHRYSNEKPKFGSRFKANQRHRHT